MTHKIQLSFLIKEVETPLMYKFDLFRFEPLPSQRVELHLYRVLGLGAHSSQQVWPFFLMASIILVAFNWIVITIAMEISMMITRTVVREGVCSLFQETSPSFRLVLFGPSLMIRTFCVIIIL